MGYIYKIKNDINDKLYIGKTEFNIHKRFAEHCHDCLREDINNRPLYKAMSLYGINHFTIELIEECDDSVLEDREKYWISYYNSYGNGYNATMGGDGKSYINYDNIIDLFLKGLNIREIAEQTGHDVGHISKILKEKGNITQNQIDKQAIKKLERKVMQLDKKTNETIQTFDSVTQAALWIIKNDYSKDNIKGVTAHISQCCNGIRKSAYQFKWSYKE